MQITSGNASYPSQYKNNNLSFCKTRILEDEMRHHGKTVETVVRKAAIITDSPTDGYDITVGANNYHCLVSCKPGFKAILTAKTSPSIKYPTNEEIKLLFERTQINPAEPASKKLKNTIKKFPKKTQKNIKSAIKAVIESIRDPEIKTSRRFILCVKSLVEPLNYLESTQEVETHISMKQSNNYETFCRDFLYAIIDGIQDTHSKIVELSTPKKKEKTTLRNFFAREHK